MVTLTPRMWRLAKELTIADMSKALGVHPNTYAKWEKHPERISFAVAEKIATIFDVPMSNIEFATKES